MHPQEFRNIIDHLHDSYCTLHEEVHRLRKENRGLTEELSKIKSLNSALNAKITNFNSSKIIKMGAEWFLDGDFLLNLSLMRRLKFRSPISNAKISKEGKIAISCNRQIFLIVEKCSYLVENVVEQKNITMKNELVDFDRRIFDFLDEDLIAFHKNCVIKLNGTEKEWTLDIGNVRHIATDRGLIYIGVEEGYIHVYRRDGVFVKSIEINRDYDRFIVKDGVILLVFQESLTILPSSTYIGNQRIIGSDFDGKIIYYGGTSGVVNLAMPSGNSIQPYDTLNFKTTILSIMKYKNYLFVATEDRVVNVVDLDSKKNMRIVLMDNVVDMCCEEGKICFVDNNGGLREWSIIENA